MRADEGCEACHNLLMSEDEVQVVLARQDASVVLFHASEHEVRQGMLAYVYDRKMQVIPIRA